MVLSFAAVLMLGLLAAGHADSKTVLFSGSLQGAELGSWGSGTIELDEEESYLEGEALRVETTGFYEGGRLQLTQPLAADTFLSDPEGGYVRLVVKVHEPEEQAPVGPGGMMGPGGFPAEPGMMPAEPGMFPAEPGMVPPEPGMIPGQPGMMPGQPGVDPGMMIPPEDPAMMGMPPEPGMMMPGMEPGMEPGMMGPAVGGVGVPQGPPPKIEQLRVLLVTDMGAVDSGPIVLADYAEIVEDWVQVVVPMSAFKGADLTGSSIQHVALFGDVEETFWVGELELGYEEQPLVADAGENITTTVDRMTPFEAAPQPEGVSASYVWDFDDLDGIQEEGYGAETSWTFLTPGYYVVTLTVKDPAGRRVDRVDRIHVKVTE